MLPSLSIVIPYHNEGLLLRQTIESVAAQDYEGEVEVIVCDDASEVPPPPDLPDRWPLRVLRSEDHLFLPDARNMGIRTARGELVSFIDADDVYMPGALAEQAEYLARDTDAVLVGGPCYVHRGDVTLRVPWVVENVFPELAAAGGRFPDTFRFHVVMDSPFASGAMMARREAMARVGGFVSDLRWGEEWDLQVKLAQLGPVGYLPRPVMRYLCRSGSITSTLNPAKFESAARLFRSWRRIIDGLPVHYRKLLRRREHEKLLLAAQVYLENRSMPGKALACALAAQRRGLSLWGVRSLCRAGLRACCPWMGRKGQTRANGAARQSAALTE